MAPTPDNVIDACQCDLNGILVLLRDGTLVDLRVSAHEPNRVLSYPYAPSPLVSSSPVQLTYHKGFIYVLCNNGHAINTNNGIVGKNVLKIDSNEFGVPTIRSHERVIVRSADYDILVDGTVSMTRIKYAQMLVRIGNDHSLVLAGWPRI